MLVVFTVDKKVKKKSVDSEHCRIEEKELEKNHKIQRPANKSRMTVAKKNQKNQKWY